MLANPTRCPICDGLGSFTTVATAYRIGNRVQPSKTPCSRCRGAGQVCMDCLRPEGVCECPTEPAEPCEDCGKLPWACRCK